MKAKTIVAILAIAAMLVVPATAFASEFRTSPRTVIEGHTTYAVVVREREANNTVTESHNFSAVAGFARHLDRTVTCTQTQNNGVLWFNDQFFIDAANSIACVVVVNEDCTIGCFVKAAETGNIDPDLMTLCGVTFTYGYTDPNVVAWTTREFSCAEGYYWEVAIGATTQDAAANNAANPPATSNVGTAPAPVPNLGDSDGSSVNGCSAGDGLCASDPDADGGGTDHNPVGAGPNVRAYNFVVLIDIHGSVAGPGSAVEDKITNASTPLGCIVPASDDGNSHASQGAHPNGCSHSHRTGAVDLWFSHTAGPAGAGLVRNYASTGAYHV
ncbi:MAG: hypothetical protein HY556_11310 [Euryarchaeota archaeon]|nr:hypothetical protein [Euryarchaeota archaeon]